MCTLAIYFRAFEQFPLVIAANRDEFLSRPTSGPMQLDAPGLVFGGRDEVAGGTWLAVNACGVVAALLNRRSESEIDPKLRSRGRLCVDALACSSAAQAREWMSDVDAGAYNPFNLLVADEATAWVATNHREALNLQDLSPGLHVLTNLDLNDPTCPRIAASYRLFAGVLENDRSRGDEDLLVPKLRDVLRRHDTALDPRAEPPGTSLCVHTPLYGTRSSTLVFRDRKHRWTYFHCSSPPCTGEYVRLAIPVSLQKAS